MLPTLRDAFSQIVWPEGTDVLRRDVDGLFRELNDLLETLSENRLTLMPKRTALSDFPLLWKHACAPRGAVNLKYLDPFGGRPRDHDRYVFFHADDDRVIVPAPFTHRCPLPAKPSSGLYGARQTPSQQKASSPTR